MRLILARTLALVTGIIIILLSMIFAYVGQPSLEKLPNQTQKMLNDIPVEQQSLENLSTLTLKGLIDSAETANMLILGKQVYDEERCRICHSIDGEGNRRFPLDGVGSRLTEQEILKWIVAPQEMDPDVHKPAYDHLPQEQIDAMVIYMQSLK